MSLEKMHQTSIAATTHVSLITGTFGRVEFLDRYLASLVKSQHKPFELIIVDQNEDDRAKNIIERFAEDLPIKYVRSVTGLSRARNLGLRMACGSIVAFPDDDCWYAPDLLSRVVEKFAERREIDFLALRTVDAERRESIGRFLPTETPVSTKNVWRCCNSNGLFLRAGLCTKLRFDEELGVGSGTQFGSGEETDFILSALSNGATGLYLPEPTVFHDQVPPDAPGPLGSRSKLYAQGHAAVMVKHNFGIVAMCNTLLRSFVSAIRYIFLLNLRMAEHKIFWTIGLVVGFASYRKLISEAEVADPAGRSGDDESSARRGT